MTLGEAIYTARQERKRSLRSVAAKVGITPSFMSDIEHGRRKPTEARLGAIAKAIGVAVQTLQDMTLTREAAHALENDPELLALVRRCARDRRYRSLVLRTASRQRRA